MRLLSVDVGSTRSGYVILDTRTRDVLEAGDVDNGVLLHRMLTMAVDAYQQQETRERRPLPLVVEWFASHDPSTMAALGTLDRAIKARDWTMVAKAKASVSAGATTTGNIATSAVWLGMFLQSAGHTPATVGKITRAEVKRMLRVSGAGADAQVRAAMIDTYGAGSEKKGGALAMVKGDSWSALAVAVCYLHREKLDKEADETIRKGVM